MQRLVDSYLAFLGIDIEEPTLSGLSRLHRRHLERIAYSNLDVQLGRPLSVDPFENLASIVDIGTSGYCFNANAAFYAVLTTLGYEVTLRPSWIEGSSANRVPSSVASPFTLPTHGIFTDTNPNHVLLVVHDLPTEAHPSGEWWVDVGLGEGPLTPLPLAAGTYEQAPFEYRLVASELFPSGLRFLNAPNAQSFPSCEISPDAATSFEDFAGIHAHLSSCPEAGFVRTFAAIRRYDGGLEKLVGCDLTRIDASGSLTTELDDPAAWFAALSEHFHIHCEALTQADRTRLWQRVSAGHGERKQAFAAHDVANG